MEQGFKLAHLVRATAEARPFECWVALDLSNAFGTMLRDVALEAAEQVLALAVQPDAVHREQRLARPRPHRRQHGRDARRVGYPSYMSTDDSDCS